MIGQAHPAASLRGREGLGGALRTAAGRREVPQGITYVYIYIYIYMYIHVCIYIYIYIYS